MADRYLITGGAGFIGSHIVRRLVADGQRVRVVDNLVTGLLPRIADLMDGCEFIEKDLADDGVCDEVVDGIDFVIHQAAIPSVQRSVRDPITSHRANVTATLNLLESCKKAKVQRFVYAASSSAYGDTEVLPKVETMATNPLSPYALQKLVGERYCQLYFELYGLETVCLRYFNVFGPQQDPHSEYSAVIPKFATKLLAGETITVNGDGEQSRDFTYVENVVQANLQAIKAKAASGKVCNIGCGTRLSLNQLIKALEKIIGKTASVTYGPPRRGDVRHSLADIRQAKALLGYYPGIAIEEGLQRTVATYR